MAWASCAGRAERPTLLPMTFATDALIQQPSVQTTAWRLVTTVDLPGSLNMAVDEALLDSVIRGAAPVLRFYTWQPPALSLGVNQPFSDIDPAACRSRGFDIVRRITGGRAVLHQHELTYSLLARDSDERVSGGVLESYRKISQALVVGLRSLGIDVSLAEPRATLVAELRAARRGANGPEPAPSLAPGSFSDYSAACFDMASAYELNAGGRKLVGSAQARRGGAILQHGSILLDVDWQAWTSVFAYPTERAKTLAAEKLQRRMTSIARELGRVVSGQQVAAVLARAFEAELHINLEPGDLSREEWEAAARLAAEKYGSPGWTERV